MLNTGFIDTLDKDECMLVIERARDRLKVIAKSDPMVYAIKRISKRYGVMYKSRSPWALGNLQTLAKDLNHKYLWVAASKRTAEIYMADYVNDNRLLKTGDEYEIVEIPKAELCKLPCWRMYKHLSVFHANQNGDNDESKECKKCTER